MSKNKKKKKNKAKIIAAGTLMTSTLLLGGCGFNPANNQNAELYGVYEYEQDLEEEDLEEQDIENEDSDTDDTIEENSNKNIETNNEDEEFDENKIDDGSDFQPNDNENMVMYGVSETQDSFEQLDTNSESTNIEVNEITPQNEGFKVEENVLTCMYGPITYEPKEINLEDTEETTTEETQEIEEESTESAHIVQRNMNLCMYGPAPTKGK